MESYLSKHASLSLSLRLLLGIGLSGLVAGVGCGEAEEVSLTPVGPKTGDITVTHIGTPQKETQVCAYPDSHLEGHWVGQYKCSNQGVMKLDIQMERVRSELMATIAFQPSEHAAEGTQGGEWRARVEYGDNGWMSFEPDQWVNQPDDSYRMLMLRGRVNGASAQKITGPVVDQKSCSNFTLRRVDAHPCTGAPPQQEPAEETQSKREPLTGTWSGSTTCDGTLIDLSVVIGPPQDADWVADVYFETSRDGEAVLHQGRWQSDVEKKSTSATVRLVPQDWSDDSSQGQEKLDISGRLNSSATQITAEILNISGCRNLILRHPSHRGP